LIIPTEETYTNESRKKRNRKNMSGTELIMGMEEVVQHIRELEKREENLKEALAQKFYKHYDEMDYDKLSLARTIGPDLGRMVDHLMEENKRLKGGNESLEKTLEQAKETAYHMGVDIFSDSDDQDEEEEGVITDLNGTKIKVPSEEECLQKFGVTQGEFIALAKQSICSEL